jgi:hypothetical protein
MRKKANNNFLWKINFFYFLTKLSYIFKKIRYFYFQKKIFISIPIYNNNTDIFFTKKIMDFI